MRNYKKKAKKSIKKEETVKSDIIIMVMLDEVAIKNIVMTLIRIFYIKNYNWILRKMDKDK